MKITVSILLATLLIGCSSETTTNQASSDSAKQVVIEAEKQENTKQEPSSEDTAKTNQEINQEVAFDAKTTFTKTCASCHGNSGEKVALNTSAILNTMSKDEISQALKGYKDGTYGKKMKSLMQGQVKPFNDEELDALAEYISTL